MIEFNLKSRAALECARRYIGYLLMCESINPFASIMHSCSHLSITLKKHTGIKMTHNSLLSYH